MEAQVAKHLPAQDLALTVLDKPFSTERRLVAFPHGATIATLLTMSNIPESVWHRTIVILGDSKVRREYWHTVRPKVGHQLIIKVLPGDNEVLFYAGLIALTLVAPGVGEAIAMSIPGWGSAAALGAATTIATVGVFAVGYLALNALVPLNAEEPADGYSGKQSFSITASQNRFAPFSVMPCVLGTVRSYPPYAAKPFSEIVGDDQYLRLLFVVGYKDLEISDLKLGETSLSTYEDVEYEVVCGGVTGDVDEGGNPVSEITLFTESVNEVQASQLLALDSYYTFTTDPGTDEFSIDYTAPQGLLIVKNQGTKDNVSVPIIVEYTDDPDASPVVWTAVTGSPFSINGKSGSVIRKGVRFAFPSRGQYTVRTRRDSKDKDPDSAKPVHNDDVYVTAHRSITNENPVTHDNAALIAVRIRATDQLSGQVSDFNCMASSIVNDYTGGSPEWATQESNNPASLIRYVLQGNANANPVADSRIDLTALEEFHTECAGTGTSPVTVARAYNNIIDFKITLWEMLQQIAGAGRGRVAMIDGRYTVVRDKEQATPIQYFTPRNSFGFKGEKAYIEVPHGFRVRFPNDEQGYEIDERIVYDDGYDSDNATDFQTIQLPGVTSPSQVWSLGRYHLAVARLRPEVFTFGTDIESLACTQGDLIRVSHPAILVGLGAARITAVTLSGTSPDTVASITLDVAQDCDGTTTYVARIRHADGTGTLHTITPNASPILGTHDEWVLSTPAPLTDGIAVGDLVMFGESGEESIELIVDSITPGPDLTAQLKCYSYNSAIYTADTGEIPAFDSHITTPAGSVTPVISYIQSDEWVMTRGADGSLQPNIVITLGFPQNRENVREIEAQFRPRTANNDQWLTVPTVAWDASHITISDVEESVEYELRVHYRMLDGTYGPFTAVQYHTVVGKTTLPPDCSSFSVTRQPDGTREFRWTISAEPPDLAGYRIKYYVGVPSPIPTWENMTALHTGLLDASPWETNQLSSGSYTAAIVAVDSGGRESENPLYITSTLGDPRIANAVVNENIHQAAYPGTKTNCWVDEIGNLVPTGQITWNNVAASPHQWDAWTSWNPRAVLSPEFTMSYEGTASDPGSPEVNYYDLGSVFTFQPLVSATTVDGTGTIKYYERHKDTLGAAWSAYAEITGTVSARYVQIKLEVLSPPAGGVNSLTVVLSADTVAEYINDFDMSTDYIDSPHVVGDVRLPLNNSYAVITSVKLALQNVGPNHSWELIDKSTSLGPRVKVYNNAASPALADVTIDAEVIGILSS
jgi:hypothetical protein